ncbi:LamG-like jellyroll fold domain-containing protein [Reichenbachiella sp.]|uniref:LamG-like jellyroll fold domain-containing protein n=1 Tax=Reichenbachiella sp. TaxID=2184521 RepID=UPI0032973611
MKALRKYTKHTVLLLTVLISCFSCSDDEEETNDALKPQVALTASATAIEFGSSVTFTDASTNTPTLWTWDMPGATPSYSNASSVTVVYESAGEYDVTLTVRNEFGGDEILMEKHIVVTAPPVIDIDTEPQVRLNFDENLNNDGLTGTAATSAGGPSYTIRPGGGGAFTFSGSNALTIPGYTGINGNGVRSAALWLKTTNDAIVGLVHWGNVGTLSRSSFKLQNTGHLRYEFQGGGHTGLTTVNDGEWHHVAYTFDGDVVKIYVDGVEDISVAGNTLDTGNTGETDVNIGSQLGTSLYVGDMDDVRIFDVVLTPAEVKTLSEIK